MGGFVWTVLLLSFLASIGWAYNLTGTQNGSPFFPAGEFEVHCEWTFHGKQNSTLPLKHVIDTGKKQCPDHVYDLYKGRIEPSCNGSFILKNLSPEDEGWYRRTCDLIHIYNRYLSVKNDNEEESLQGSSSTDDNRPGQSRMPISQPPPDPSIELTRLCKAPEVANIVPPTRLYYAAGFGMKPQCAEGYEASENWITCQQRGSTNAWSAEVTCIKNCMVPDVANILPPTRLHYAAGFGMKPQCAEGYEPSEYWINCERRGSANAWNAEVTCIENCKAPEVANIVPPNILHYAAGFGMKPQCAEGYEASENWITCQRRGSTNAWSAKVTCIKNCMAPDVANMVPPTRLHYAAGFGMKPQCAEGYEPSEYWINCERRGSANAWNVKVTCIGIVDVRTKTTTQVSRSSSETGNIGLRATTTAQVSRSSSEKDETQKEAGSSFTVFNCIQVVQIGALLLCTITVSLYYRSGGAVDLESS